MSFFLCDFLDLFDDSPKMSRQVSFFSCILLCPCGKRQLCRAKKVVGGRDLVGEHPRIAFVGSLDRPLIFLTLDDVATLPR